MCSWTYPASTDSLRGLGGGIAWAWDPALCGVMQPIFREDLFFASLVQCKDLTAAMHRAFDSWAANHRVHDLRMHPSPLPPHRSLP